MMVANSQQRILEDNVAIHSIKCSVKLAQKVSLTQVIQHCREEVNRPVEKVRLKIFNNFIVLSQVLVGDGNKTAKEEDGRQTRKKRKASPSANASSPIKYTVFKYSDRIARTRYYYRQHCNICGIRSFSQIVTTLHILAEWLQLPVDDLFLQVDNLIATTKLPSPINKLNFVRINQSQVNMHHQFERFPAIIVKPRLKSVRQRLLLAASSTKYCIKGRGPKRQKRKGAGVAALLYASGSIVITGAKSENEVDECCDVLASCFARYLKQQQQQRQQKQQPSWTTTPAAITSGSPTVLPAMTSASCAVSLG